MYAYIHTYTYMYICTLIFMWGLGPTQNYIGCAADRRSAGYQAHGCHILPFRPIL